MPGGQRIEASIELRYVKQRLTQTAANLPPAHGRQRRIEHAEQRALDRAAAYALGQLQIAPGGLVQRHELRGAVAAQASDLGEAILLGLLEILEQPARGAHGQRFVFTPIACQGGRAEMIEQRLPRGGLLEAPGDVGGDVENAQEGRQGIDAGRLGTREEGLGASP